MNTIINLSGLTCGHCVASVTEELKELRGVEDVHVTLNKGGISTASITAQRELTETEISEAVAEAGYLLVSDEA